MHNQHPLKVGDILVSSWGSDQTNIDYYQVTGLRGMTQVVIQEIGAATVHSSGSSDYTKPLPGYFLENSKPMVKIPRADGAIHLTSRIRAYPWDGMPNFHDS